MKTSKSYTHKVSKALDDINRLSRCTDDDEKVNDIIIEVCKKYGLNEKNIRTIGKL